MGYPHIRRWVFDAAKANDAAASVGRIGADEPSMLAAAVGGFHHAKKLNSAQIRFSGEVRNA
jgi:hypothetical protein